MISVVNRPTTRPITVLDAIAYLGVADDPNGLVANLLEATIRDVELCTGAGIGVSEVVAELYPPVPWRLRLPYSPIAAISRVTLIDEKSGDELPLYQGTGPAPFVLRQRVPAELIFINGNPAPWCVLRIEYSGGYSTLPPELRSLILQTLAARWAARSTTVMPDVAVDDDAYLKVIT